jgi:DNA polymerase-4
VTAEKLRKRGITTVGQVAAIPEAALVWMLGRASGRHLHALAHNRDPRPVVRRRRRRSIGSQCALGRGRRTPDEIDAIVIALVDGVARRLRRGRRVGRTVVLRLRFDDFTRATRSRTLRRPTAHTGTFLAALRELLAAARPLVAEKGLTLVGVAVTNLEDDAPRQLVLPFDDADMALDTAVDQVRERFGRRSVTRAVVLGIGSRRWSIDVEDLED